MCHAGEGEICPDYREWPERGHDDGSYLARCGQVITATGDGIAHVVSFMDPDLFRHFDLPAEK